MKPPIRPASGFAFALLFLLTLGAFGADAISRSWIDPDTGHRVVQLSVDPGTVSLYFTQYTYTAGGTKMILTTPAGIQVVTLATGAIERVYQGPYGRVIQTGRATGKIYFTVGDRLVALDPKTRDRQTLARLPAGGVVWTINADETLAAGAIEERPAGRPADRLKSSVYQSGQGVQKGDMLSDKHENMDKRLAQRIPMTLFTLNLRTGERRDWLKTTDWIDHFQFSPTDPTLLMYAHEGRQWKLDRIWLLRLDGRSRPQLVHQRTMRMEIAVHEYWSDDGQWIWYDLQTPLSEDFWIAGFNPYSGRRLWYHLPPGVYRSVHYNTSPDGRLFAGDGSGTDPALVYGHPHDSKWMFLFRPQLVPNLPGETPDQAGMIQAGTLTCEKLVNLAKHDYSLEPNGTFTPDGKWVVFRSNMRGPFEVYAVEVAKADR